MRAALSLCVGDLKRLFKTPKIYLVFIFTYFFLDNFVLNIKDMAIYFKIGITPFVYPVFLSEWQGRMLSLLTVILLMSDAPFYNGNEKEVFIRVSNNIWCLSKALYIVALSFIYQISAFILSVVACAPYIAISNTWGSAIRSYATSLYGVSENGIAEMVINELPVEILLKELLISFLVGIIIGFTVLIFNVLSLGYAGTLITSALVVSDAFFEMFNEPIMDIILSRIPFFWISIPGLNTGIGYKTACGISFFLTFVLTILAFFVVKFKIEKLRER